MTRPKAAASPKQRGVLIVAIMAAIAIAMIFSTVAVQAWSDVARRDAEAEMMFRAQDICRALKRFQTDRGRLPTELKELLEVGQRRPQYFLRQMWKDPLVKGGKWQLIYASPAGGFIDPTVQNPGAPGGLGGPGTIGNPSTTGNPSGAGAPLTPISTGLTADTFSTFPPFGNPAGNPAGNPGELTGMPIAGVKSKCTDRPFRKYKDKTQYSEWVFTIFDLDPRATVAPGMTPGANPGATPGVNPGLTPGTTPVVPGGK